MMMKDQNKPATIESLLDVLRYNGYSPELEDTYHNGDMTIKFKQGPMLFKIDPTNLPYLTISTACRMNHDTDDINIMYQAANEVNSSVKVGKVIIIEYYPLVLFNVEMLCNTDMYFRNKFKTFMDIIFNTVDHFLSYYDILTDKNKMIQKALKANEQDELPF
jgi:hypothetical protein